MMYVVKRTTVFLPEDLKAELARAARREGVTESELIRRGLRMVLARSMPPAPKIPLFRGDDPTLAERVDELLRGFGES